MSGMRKAVAGLAGLVLAGGACLGGIAAAPVAGAASAACGHSCSSLYNQKFGTADVSAVSGGTAAPNQAVVLAAAAPSTTEDWEVAFQGTVNDFFNAGLINATLDEHYGTDGAFEFQYTPGGISSGLCLGIASGPAQGTKVTLQPCGVTVRHRLDQRRGRRERRLRTVRQRQRHPVPGAFRAHRLEGRRPFHHQGSQDQ